MYDFIDFGCRSGLISITSYHKHKVFFPKAILFSYWLFSSLMQKSNDHTYVDSVGSKLSMES